MEKTFIITATMDEKWMVPFINMLYRMEKDGIIGHSEYMTFYADGDGDFRPSFQCQTDKPIEKHQPLLHRQIDNTVIFDIIK